MEYQLQFSESISVALPEDIERFSLSWIWRLGDLFLSLYVKKFVCLLRHLWTTYIFIRYDIGDGILIYLRVYEKIDLIGPSPGARAFAGRGRVPVLVRQLAMPAVAV